LFGDVTDELILVNTIDGIVDYYFCSDCEKKLSILENEYAKTINGKTQINNNYQSTLNSNFSFLFWVSIFWRLSIEIDSGFKLKEKDEKKLKNILKKYLTKTADIQNLDLNDVILNDIGYKIVRSPHFSDKNYTWLHWSTSSERPYILMIDEYIIYFYFKKNHLKGIKFNFYGSEEHNINAYFNTPFYGEFIFGVPHDEYEVICKNVTNFGVKKRFEFIDKKLDEIHSLIGGHGKHMYPKYKQEIFRRIANSEQLLGQKGTTEEYINIIIDTIQNPGFN
jgi:hypothetical protein